MNHWAATVVLLFGLGAASVQAAATPVAKIHGGMPGYISVKTQNLYIGTDILEIVEAESFCDILAAADAAVEQVLENDFEQRAIAIAELIRAQRPHVVGLQEAEQVRLTDFWGQETRSDDYLALLVDALGGDYYVAHSRSSQELEIPVNATGDCDPDNAIGAIDSWAYVIDQDAVLCRRDVSCTDGLAANFEVNTSAPTPAGDVLIERGWVGTVASVKGHRYRVINTHLEVSGTPALQAVQYLQSLELVAAMNALKPEVIPQIALGDFNADDAVESPSCEGLAFCQTAYQVLEAAGFIDTWWIGGAAQEPGYTCCQDADLRNETSALGERIDQVWVRGAAGQLGSATVLSARSEVQGDQPADRSQPDGLWPSDHAGVISRIWLQSPSKHARGRFADPERPLRLEKDEGQAE